MGMSMGFFTVYVGCCSLQVDSLEYPIEFVP